MGEAEGAKLDAYAGGCGALYCRHASGVCEPSCPNGVPVNTIPRYQQYFAGQRREKEAMGYYDLILRRLTDIRPCRGAWRR